LVADATSQDWREYKPLQEYTGLFQILAETPATPDGILAFANRFGALYSKSPTPVSEPMELWELEINQLRMLVLAQQHLRDTKQIALLNKLVTGSLYPAAGQPMRFSPVVTARGIELMPLTLDGAIWLQCAQAIAENKKYRRCPARDCPSGGWFEVSKAPFGRRTDADFCSPRCRHVAYRDRKAEGD
jgi:hypothetical protein